MRLAHRAGAGFALQGNHSVRADPWSALFFIILVSALQFFGNKGAKRLFCHIVTGHAKRSCSATSADIVIFAYAAFTFVISGGSKLLKLLGISPNLRERGCFNVPAINLKIAAGLYLSCVADKTKARSPKASSS